jgi:mono/diheme cytochrome c family protein
MRRRLIRLCVLLSAGILAASTGQAADSDTGGQIAQRWCATCHLIGGSPTGSVQQGPPNFSTIAKRDHTDDQLRSFLSHPHGAMPDLSLTRAEIEDLIAYLHTVR